ncbi:MAG: type II/IV secretion system protein [Phycisphaeraceae bacterium]|nr:type II/IV secretion system protein [Phycisphaeraceae bacterium]MBX3367712.1 type II/IV secretion system protein [Phycisphaeraceae bacterium]
MSPAPEANVVIEPVHGLVALADSQVEPLPAVDTPLSASTPTLPEAAVPSRAFLSLIPHEFARRHLILSAGSESTPTTEVEHLLITERTNPAAVFNVGVTLQRTVRTTLGSPESIAAAIDRVYLAADENAPRASDTPQVTVMGSSDVERDLSDAISETERDLLSTHGKAPAVRLVDLILFEALLRDASDIHIQPVRGRTLIRYRMDGALYTVRELPGSMASALVSRIKVMAQLNVAEHRAPQDGRATVTVGSKGNEGSQGSWAGRRVDLRISTLPSTYGERVVIRLLDPSKSPHVLSFAALGMPSDVERPYLAQVDRPNGIVLVTGPTGSGKTTTLYTTLAWISSSNTRGSAPQHHGKGRATGCEVNMMTVEDPVEYDLSGAGLSVSQTQVDAKRGVTFATGLRHILRQDPDVIMVGEIRDEETARMAVQASLTGHLVMSTLHTNDAPSAVARLVDLGVEPFLVSSSLSAVLAQRLVRCVHRHCEGKGCEDCLGSGYRGRTGVFELLVCDAAMKELVQTRHSTGEVAAVAIRGGMRTLRQHGEALVAEGLTTAAEVARVIAAGEGVQT